MTLQYKDTSVIEIGDIYQYSQLDMLLSPTCIKICFRNMTEDEFKRANKLHKTRVPAIFASDYAVCTRAIIRIVEVQY